MWKDVISVPCSSLVSTADTFHPTDRLLRSPALASATSASNNYCFMRVFFKAVFQRL